MLILSAPNTVVRFHSIILEQHVVWDAKLISWTSNPNKKTIAHTKIAAASLCFNSIPC